MGTFWRDNLKHRIPEYHQDSKSMEDYLDVCGGIYDRLVQEIEKHDIYHDYKQTPEGRLSLIARSFGFDTDFDIETDMFRYIVRDLNHLIRTRGIKPALEWCFKLVGWEVTINDAWLPDPHKYDHRIIDFYPELFYGDPDNETPTTRTDGQPTSATQETVNTSIYFTDDYFKVDYRNFLYGTTEIKDTGVYFSGGPLFGSGEEYKNIRIVGEQYQNANGVKDPLVVASTPYLVINIDNESALELSNVVDKTEIDGETELYTFSEKYNLLRGLLDYLLYDFEKPSHVVIIAILTNTDATDEMSMTDSFEGNKVVSNRSDASYLEELSLSSDYKEMAEHDIPIIGKDLYIGQPTIPFSDSITSFIDMYTIGGVEAFVDNISSYESIDSLVYSNEYIDTFSPDLKYRAIGHSDVPFTIKYDGDIGIGRSGTNSDGDWVSYGLHMRTPSRVTIETDKPLGLEYKKHIEDEWTKSDVKIESGITRLEVNDVFQVKLTSPLTTINIEVTTEWLPQGSFVPDGNDFFKIDKT